MNETTLSKSLPPTGGTPGGEQPFWRQLLESGTLYQQLGTLASLAAAATLGIGLIMWASKPSMVPVFDRVARDDIQRITDVLRADNIPYQIESGSGLVLIPQDRLDAARIKLSAEGLPQSANVGLEMLRQDQALGTSRFVENARYQHALETELSRTISSMRNVETARVHLALPKQSVFIRERAKPSASVMVKLQSGRTLEDGQVAAIVHLVASSISYMESSDVTIVDQWGRLLSSGDGANGAQASRKQLAYVAELENRFVARVEELLTAVVGPGKVRAKVNVDADFSENEQTQELYEPSEGKVRSEQVQDQETKGSIAALGIPGALTNQPPDAGETDPNAAQQNGENKTPTSTSKQATRNYELDRTITHTRRSQGGIKRVSVAVLVDDKTVIDNGQATTKALDAGELDNLTRLVKEAVGFNEQRGDSVFVINQSFQPVAAIEPIAPPPLWEQPWVWGLGKQVLAGIGVLLLILMVFRPALRNLKQATPIAPAAAALPTLEATLEEKELAARERELEADRLTLSHDAHGVPMLPPPQVAYEDMLDMARTMAAEDPKRVAQLIKNWVTERG
ncbi:MAG: flagellar basal-body MS-ring/collar protein FliF [Thiotrichales bacterium]